MRFEFGLGSEMMDLPFDTLIPKGNNSSNEFDPYYRYKFYVLDLN